MKYTFKTLAAATALSLAAVSAQAALIVPAGNGLVVNDSSLNIAWTQDANLFKTQANSYAGGAAAFVTAVISASGGIISDKPNSLDTPANSGSYNLTASDFNTSTGNMNWWGAKAWVNYLNTISYAGTTDWRLPQITPVNGSSFVHTLSYDGTTDRGFNSTAVNATASELAHLFLNELGNLSAFNTAGVAQVGSGLINSGPFSNFQSAPYWTGTEFQFPTTTTDFVHAWLFSNANGAQGSGAKNDNTRFFAIAVHDGQIPAVFTPSVREDNDGDHHADILWYNPVSVIAGTGYGDAYELLSDVGAPVPTAPITVTGGFAGVPIPDPWTIKGRGDYNGDGKSDLLWGNSTNQLYIALRTTASPSAYSLPAAPLSATCAPATSSVVGTGDYNGDSLSDILLKDTAGNVSVLLMNGTTILNTATCATTFAAPPTTTSAVKGTGDYDGDGKSDVLWGNSAGQVDVQYNGVTGTTTLTALSGLVVEGSGNFDGDATHKSDILLRSTAGDVSVKTDVQAAPSTAGMPISAPGIIAGANVPNAWVVKGTGDYDGDGKNDVLWRNTSATDPASGYNFIFLMNGATVRTGVSNFLPAPYDVIPVSAGWDVNYTQTQ